MDAIRAMRSVSGAVLAIAVLAACNGSTVPTAAASPHGLGVTVGPSAGRTSAPTEPNARPAPPVVIAELTGAPDGLDGPVDATVDPTGNVWVAEGNADRFAIFRPDGTFLERWGRHGAANGELDCASAATVRPSCPLVFLPDGTFFVGDSGNARIQRFDAARHWLSSIGRFGNGNGEFVGRLAVALTADGRLFVADEARQIQLFDPAGRFVRRIGAGAGAGQWIARPLGLALDGSRLFVTEGDAERSIVEFTDDGRLVRRALRSGLAEAADIDVGPDGFLYVADGHGTVAIVDPEFLTVVGVATVGAGRPDSTVDGLGFTPSGRLVVADATTNRVEILERP